MSEQEEIIDTTTPEFVEYFQGFINHPQQHPTGSVSEQGEQERKHLYIALLTGKGEGCDYTIGCNRTTIEVIGESLDEAEKNLVEHIQQEYSGFSGLKESYGSFDIFLVEVARSRAIDMPAYIAQEQREEDQAKRQEAEKREQAEYERLKAKYEASR